MKLTTILFDLDGTLLPMDNDEFTRGYFKLLAAKMAPLGYEPKRLVDAIWTGTAAMVKNDGSRSNETAFWQAFGQIYGDRAQADRPIFEAFYENEFQNARAICGFDPAAAQSVRELKRRGFSVALATNPIFPSVATESRIRWAGLEPEEFALYTTYENTAYCKPNPAYYRDVAQRLGVDPAACLMVGNDANEDMAARAFGMDVFLLTDCLINTKNRDISVYPQGDFAALNAYLDRLNSEK